ncbi:MAG: aminotransferase class III-fold pyridoxal phosphate-dependent enzyme [Bacillota bacterium]
MNTYTEFVNPHLGKLLESIMLDKSFMRGEGCHLYDAAGKRYLDCIAAYGALPFGHNHPEIWGSIERFHRSGEPSFVQPSALNAAGALAQKLIEVAPVGLRYVTFTNSGAEAVEAALKLCRAATGRRGILSTTHSFHGKTLGALSATGNSGYQGPFGAPVADFRCIEFGNTAALENELTGNPGYYAAFIVEPIQGEGGIIEPPPGYLAAAKKLCEAHGALLVLDEVQTGLGRTGALFACEADGISPDVLVLAKALGGGIMPVGACLSTEASFSEDFGMKHSSTFAGNSLACRVGLQVLEMLGREEGRLLAVVRENGALLRDGLLRLRERYPHLINSVRGRGLMLGLEFNMDRDIYPGSLLGIMAEQELLTPAISAHLLNVEGIRVAPTLNGNAVIRIEPPLIITKDQCREALAGIENMLRCLNEGSTARFLSFLVGGDHGRDFPSFIPERVEKVVPAGDENEGRFAFLIHALDLQSYHQFDHSLRAFSEAELGELTGKFNDMIQPFVISRTAITSAAGRCAYGEFIAVPRTTEEFVKMPRQQALSELKAAVALARERGARIVGLGAFTSVASMGGLFLKDEGVPVTTGNSYTVVSAVDAVNAAIDRLQVNRNEITAAVVGAAGSIGKGIAMLLSERVPRLVLIGNPNNTDSSQRLHAVAAEIYCYQAALINQGRPLKQGSMGLILAGCAELPPAGAPQEAFEDFVRGAGRKLGLIELSTDIDAVLARADVVVSATSSDGKIIHAGNLKRDAIVCDVSRPANVSEAVDRARPDVLVIDGGVIEVPGLPSLGWDFGFEQGLSYACMAETMMLALEQHYKNYSLGSSGVNLETILQTRTWAAEHGFKLAAFRSFNRPLSEDSWQKLLLARRRAG